MKKHFGTLLSFVCVSAGALIFSGCGNKTASAETSQSQTITDPAVLTAKTWELETIGGVAIEKGAYQRLPSLQFDTSATRAFGFTPVNNYNGAYTLSGTSLTFGPVVSTRMAGPQPDMELEMKFNKIFDTVTGWKIAGGKLTLLTGDSELATFTEKTP